MTWSGLYTALITPFKEEQLDEEGLRQNIRAQRASGVDGIVLLGTTGEVATLTEDEKEQILLIGREEAGDLPLIVGTGDNCTQTTIENTQRAAEYGADSALVIAPYYNKPTQEGLYRHFKAISENSPIDLIIYNIPGRTAVNIEIQTLKRVAALPHVVGVKESSGDLGQVSDIVSQIKRDSPNFSLLAGDDSLTLPIMAMGGDGVISGMCNLVPKKMQELVTACLDHDFTYARRVHYELLPLFKAASFETNPIPLKAAMALCGLPAGEPRLPLCPLSSANLEKLKETLEWSKKFL
ncbi:MAG: 4-hydroxy-tetrahydrodipicolinate synthase [Chlamydiae bacterium]|nr:4-hydroxy-tetrahydrodipicolinate synthase [Chlamydiota bacterium]